MSHETPNTISVDFNSLRTHIVANFGWLIDELNAAEYDENAETLTIDPDDIENPIHALRSSLATLLSLEIEGYQAIDQELTEFAYQRDRDTGKYDD